MAEQPPQKKQKIGEKSKIPIPYGASDLIKLMKGISHGNKEVFLRELVFNASQALYRMRLQTLYECDLIGPRGFFIDIIPDKINGTLSIVDNGIGMTKNYLKKLFTIPEPILERHKQAARRLQNSSVAVDEFDSVFHLGFFAAFMVADKVEIITRRYGDDKPCMLVASARDMSFLIVGGDLSSDTTISSTPRGTKVTLHLNQDSLDDYLDEGSLKGLIDKYTFDLVPYPISIQHHPHVDEEKKKDMEKLKSQFEDLQKLFVEVLYGRNADFKHAVISDRMYDLPAFVSLDRATIEINPRNSLIKSLRQDAMNNPAAKNLLETITGLYLSGGVHSGQSLLHAAEESVRHNYPGHARLDSSKISDSFHQGRPYPMGQDVHPPHKGFLCRCSVCFRGSRSSMYLDSRHNPRSGPPLFLDLEEDANISQPGSSTPDASSLGSEHTRGSRERKSRKPIIISTDKYGRLKGGVDILKLFSFLDTISRDGHKAPLNYSGWGAMPEEYKENMWKEIQENFYFHHPHPDCKNVIMRYLMVSWSRWRDTLKRERYLSCATNEDRLAYLDERVLPDQWEYLVSYWNTEQAKATAAIPMV